MSTIKSINRLWNNLDKNLGLLAALVFVVALALYMLTLPPGLLWGGGDFALYQTYAYQGSTDTSQVGVYEHVLWVILAHPFTRLPFHDAAWRANFASAVFGAAALVFVFLSARRLTRSNVASLLATVALALSHTFWTYAVMPKVYSLNNLLSALCCYLLLLWRDQQRDVYLCLATFLYGISFLNHLVMVTVAAGFGVFILAVIGSRGRSKWMPLLLAGLCFLLGLSPYLYLVARSGAAQSTGGTAAAFLLGLVYATTHPIALLKGLGWGIVLGAYQFPITALVGLAGLGRLWRQDRGATALILLSILGTLAFMIAAVDPNAGNVYVWNLHYYLQAYVVFALAMAVGFEMLWTGWCRQFPFRRATVIGVTLALPVLLYAIAPSIARHFVQNMPDFRPLPGRDNLTYVLTPWKQNETGARELGEQILQTLPPNSVFFADYSIWAVINYLQIVEKARPDVQLVELASEGQVPLILQYRSAPNLFLADTYRYYDVEGIRQHFDIVPVGPIYRLIPQPASPSP